MDNIFSGGPSPYFITLFLWRGKFFRGSKVIFPDFFTVETFNFGRLKTNFSGFWKVKSKKKQNKTKNKKQKTKEQNKTKKQNKKEKILSSFFNFSSFHFQFFHPLFPFPSFLLQFPFFLASLFSVGQQKFPGQKSARSPSPLLLRHCPTHTQLRLCTHLSLLYDFKYDTF